MENEEDHEMNEELDLGRKAAEEVAAHMTRMGASKTQWLIPAPDGMWEVNVSFIKL